MSLVVRDFVRGRRLGIVDAVNSVAKRVSDDPGLRAVSGKRECAFICITDVSELQTSAGCLNVLFPVQISLLPVSPRKCFSPGTTV
ncbi:hypothetical protein XELAEV_18018268mg [Xenopus laevis]|uniref:Uncharacterized protein n=1 Tax=Xenopus laevis TaxID=8355 RepID=A0A974DDZ0_XENLA|nr:hypothetical protein XELAEV_18018268mg [Xenopus laevis]